VASQFETRPIDELIRAALAADEEGRWEIIPALQARNDDRTVLQAAQALCGSADPAERRLGVDVLAQGRDGRRPFQEEMVATLLTLLARETESRVLEALASALGHHHDERAIGPLLGLKDHPDADVRFAVVCALSGYDDDRAIAVLIELSRDPDADVRDWATFGLGSQIDLDTPGIRDALAARLTDSDDDTRGEALVGLAKRRDPRVIEPLLRELADPDPLGFAIDAAEAYPHPRVPDALAQVPAVRRGHWASGRMSAADESAG
jgi:HEAT repeat protein